MHVKLFYLNQFNAEITFCDFRTQNNLHKGRLSITEVKAMIKNFGKKGSLASRPDKRKTL